jgi:putative endonuclease
MMTEGQWAENVACDYLCAQGLRPVARNYRCRHGEIDLVMQHQDILVFVEVRYRSYQKYGGSRESIVLRKRRRILATAQYYLQTHPAARDCRCRFDVVLMGGQQSAPSLQWIADAFRG